MPGLRAPAFFFASAAVLLAMPSPLLAQELAPPAVQPPPSVMPVPGSLEMSKLIWSTLAAVDHANRSGNYSVLRDISAQGFQINNDPARLATIFAGIRSARQRRWAATWLPVRPSRRSTAPRLRPTGEPRPPSRA